MSVNKVILIGNVGKDPQVRYIAENKPYASFPLATSDPAYTTEALTSTALAHTFYLGGASSVTSVPASTSPPHTTPAIRLAMWKSWALMKPPSRMLTSEPLMVAMPLRPATGN